MSQVSPIVRCPKCQGTDVRYKEPSGVWYCRNQDCDGVFYVSPAGGTDVLLEDILEDHGRQVCGNCKRPLPYVVGDRSYCPLEETPVSFDAMACAEWDQK